MKRDKRSLERDFPNLNDKNFKITSPPSASYNYIAWALGESELNYWPSAEVGNYWPRRLPFEVTISAFTKLFLGHNFERCENPILEEGWEKVALYAIGDAPTHAVRQLASGNWTSKMGADEDIEIAHPSLLEGAEYGKVVQYFRRKLKA